MCPCPMPTPMHMHMPGGAVRQLLMPMPMHMHMPMPGGAVRHMPMAMPMHTCPCTCIYAHAHAQIQAHAHAWRGSKTASRVAAPRSSDVRSVSISVELGCIIELPKLVIGTSIGERTATSLMPTWYVASREW